MEFNKEIVIKKFIKETNLKTINYSDEILYDLLEIFDRLNLNENYYLNATIEHPFRIIKINQREEELYTDINGIRFLLTQTFKNKYAKVYKMILIMEKKEEELKQLKNEINEYMIKFNNN